MRWKDLDTEACPVARGLSVIGDRWNLLILRDCFLGTRRFDQLQDNLGITRHLLADRLKNLEAAGVLKRVPYQERPPRHDYRLTKMGLDLYPTLLMLMHWADTHLPSEKQAPYDVVFRDTGKHVRPQLFDAAKKTPIELGDIELVRSKDPALD